MENEEKERCDSRKARASLQCHKKKGHTGKHVSYGMPYGSDSWTEEESVKGIRKLAGMECEE